MPVEAAYWTRRRWRTVASAGAAWADAVADDLAAAGRALADHPAVHGAFAVWGPSNLHAAAYFPDLTTLYGFLDLVGLGITHVETAIVSHAAKRTPMPVQPVPSR